MAEPQPTVFLSYRRKVSVDVACLLFRDLKLIHGYDVFWDLESIGSGPFPPIILDAIADRMHFVVILTPGSLDNCQNPDDWLRREIERAMELGRNIVPILAHDFRLDDHACAHLTGKLRDLHHYNGLRLDYEYLDAALDKLRERFLQPAQGRIVPLSRQDALRVQDKIAKAERQPPPTKQELSAEYNLNWGIARWHQGDHAGAIADYDRAIDLAPDDAPAYINRGIARRRQGDHAGAIADYDRAIDLVPDDAPAYLNRGVARWRQGDHAGAIADYDRAIDLVPDDAPAYLNRGVARWRQGDHTGAIADYDHAIALAPDDAPAYYNRGNARSDQGDHAGAIADYDHAIALKSNDAPAYYNRGVARWRQGDHAGAIADYDHAIALKSNDAPAYINRGIARWRQGDHAGAIADYDHAITLEPDDATAFYNRGIARWNQGDHAGAIVDFGQYLELGGGRQYGDQERVKQRIHTLRAQLRSQSS